MYFEETAKAKGKFDFVIICVILVGLIVGIMAGFALQQPSEEALQAISDMARYPSLYGDSIEKKMLAEEIEWGTNSTIALSVTWVLSAALALLLHAQKVKIVMLDRIAGSVKKLAGEPIEPIPEKPVQTTPQGIKLQ